MKFSDLSKTQRSMLAALASAVNTTLDTGRLAGYTGGDAAAAAYILCSLREAGLVFSQQKPVSKQYVPWQITKVGMAVFESRPDGNVVVVADDAHVVRKGAADQCATQQRDPGSKRGFIVDAHGYHEVSGNIDQLVNQLELRATNNPGIRQELYVREFDALLEVPKAAVRPL